MREYRPTDETVPSEDFEYSPDAIVDRYVQLQWQWRLRRARRSKLARRAMSAGAAAGILLAPPLAVGYTDIQHGKRELAFDQSEVHEVYEYEGDDEMLRTHGTFVLTGFGTKDPSETAVSLDAHKEIGSVFAIEYSNNSLDIHDLASHVIETAREHDITQLTFDGYSLGGLIGTHVAAYIHEHTEDLAILNIIMNSSPIEPDDLTSRTKSALEPIEKITEQYPDLLYSKTLRKPIELINRYDRYVEQVPDEPHTYRIAGLDSVVINGTRYTLRLDKFREESESVDRILEDPDKASALLMSQQIQILYKRIESPLHTLSKHKNNDKTIPLTNVFYTGSQDTSQDPVINPDTSSDRLSMIMRELDNPFSILLADVQHANPVEAKDTYALLQRGEIRNATLESLTFREKAILALEADEKAGIDEMTIAGDAVPPVAPN